MEYQNSVRVIMLLLWLFLALFVLRLLTYIYRAYRCARLRVIYTDWLSGKISSILQYEKEILALFCAANVYDQTLSFDKYNAKRIMETFERAIGSFLYEIKKNFFPNYWIKTILFAPSKIIDYMGIRNFPALKMIKTILIVIYWAVGIWDISASVNESLTSPLDEIIKLISLFVEKVF